MDPHAFTVRKVDTPEDLAATIALFTAYATSLNVDLSFQDFAAEMSGMPGRYSPPTGSLLLARNTAGHPIGCVGLRSLVPGGVCEMKRLYVNPAGRGLGVGRALAEAVVKQAKALGYQAVRLDTLASMVSALGLYKSMGFVEIERYYETPLQDTVFLELALGD